MEHTDLTGPDGPTVEDLAAIEREWPLIAAEIDLVNAEIRALTVDGGPSPLDWRRLRRASNDLRQRRRQRWGRQRRAGRVLCGLVAAWHR